MIVRKSIGAHSFCAKNVSAVRPLISLHSAHRLASLSVASNECPSSELLEYLLIRESGNSFPSSVTSNSGVLQDEAGVCLRVFAHTSHSTSTLVSPFLSVTILRFSGRERRIAGFMAFRRCPVLGWKFDGQLSRRNEYGNLRTFSSTCTVSSLSCGVHNSCNLFASSTCWFGVLAGGVGRGWKEVAAFVADAAKRFMMWLAFVIVRMGRPCIYKKKGDIQNPLSPLCHLPARPRHLDICNFLPTGGNSQYLQEDAGRLSCRTKCHG